MKSLSKVAVDKQRRAKAKPVLKGFKAVAPPANPERRRLIEGPEVVGTGGCRSVPAQR
jgi:hypothetical protein